jgi:DNA primase
MAPGKCRKRHRHLWTSLTEGHAKLLPFCKHVILFRDGDKAGLRAVHRDICLRFGFKVEVVICPDGERSR